MRYVTRCPVCLALFEVRDAQRQAAQGWLRCGQCLSPFDSAGLVLPWPDSPLAAPSPAPVSSDTERLDLDTLLYRRDVSPDLVPASASSSMFPSMPVPAVHMPPTASAPDPVLSSSTPPDIPPRSAGVSLPALQSRDGRALAHRSVWWVGSLLALVFGLLQGLYTYRGPLAMHTPVVEQLGQGVCRMLGCTWPALRYARALHLDHARLLREGDAFVLSIRLRNRSPVTVSSGSVAVTLRDQKGQTQVRRVVALSTLGAAAILPPGGVWEGQTELRFPLPDEIAGFQVSLLEP